ncbi:LOW QUALITY PROTEIN: sperm acrosome-associated protein 9 [Sardina pilchardus]|uniref:LOW QUALITY PROTEIN: sperm acrosome-associated protein 9 n=1 Tax=Sardina pilchardus TaxID=27697 RepID=UPI002E108260
MNEVKERLAAIEKKKKRFKQQQFIFTSALERSQEQAHGRPEPVKTVSQIQRYMIHHCSNATDRSDLHNVLKLISATWRYASSDALVTCKLLLHPDSVISKLRAQHPHDELLRLSLEAKQHYGGVISFIPLALDLLRSAAASPDLTPDPSPVPSPTTPTTPPHSACSHAGSQKAEGDVRVQSAQPQRHPTATHTAARHAGKPAWRPAGGRRK